MCKIVQRSLELLLPWEYARQLIISHFWRGSEVMSPCLLYSDPTVASLPSQGEHCLSAVQRQLKNMSNIFLIWSFCRVAQTPFKLIHWINGLWLCARKVRQRWCVSSPQQFQPISSTLTPWKSWNSGLWHDSFWPTFEHCGIKMGSQNVDLLHSISRLPLNPSTVPILPTEAVTAVDVVEVALRKLLQGLRWSVGSYTTFLPLRGRMNHCPKLRRIVWSAISRPW